MQTQPDPKSCDSLVNIDRLHCSHWPASSGAAAMMVSIMEIMRSADEHGLPNAGDAPP
jgi:hypothetical protein